RRQRHRPSSDCCRRPVRRAPDMGRRTRRMRTGCVERLLIGQGEACKRLGVSRATLIAEIDAGRLRYVLVGKRRNFKPSDLGAYIERQGRGCDGRGGPWSAGDGPGRRPITKTSPSRVFDFEEALRRTTRKPPKSSPPKKDPTSS